MRKLRVSASMKRQLTDLRDAKGNPRRGGVMHVPRILSCDEFEAVAAPMQDALIAASYEDREKPEPVVTPVRLTNAQADHDAANRAMGEQRRQGGRPYLEHEQDRIRQITQPARPRGRGMVS